MDVLVMNEDRLDCVQGRTDLFGASDRILNLGDIRVHLNKLLLFIK